MAFDNDTYRADPERAHLAGSTGIFVRGERVAGEWSSLDIAEMDEDSLRRWLRSRGGENLWAENVVAILLDHPR